MRFGVGELGGAIRLMAESDGRSCRNDQLRRRMALNLFLKTAVVPSS